MNQKVRTDIIDGVIQVDVDALAPFQGDLKILSDDNYERIKNSIMDLGYSFVVHAWKQGDQVHILDGHQRVKALKRMRENGIEVPKIPVVLVKAKDLREAKKKVLAGASQYGEMVPDGLARFMNEFKIEIPDVTMSFHFPEIDMDNFQSAYFPKDKEVSFNAKERGAGPGKELGSEEFEQFEHTCPKCGFGFD